MKYLTTPLFVLCLLVSSIAHAQKVNPNNLPPCPKPDYSKSYDVGVGGRTEKWNNCWGRYIAKLSNGFKDDVLEGEWQNSLLHGHGTYYHLANNDFKGNKYVGEFKNGKSHGEGTFFYLANNRFKGKFWCSIRSRENWKLYCQCFMFYI